MDQWKRCQNLVEKRFGKCPNNPDELVELMIVMADMIIETREENHQLRLHIENRSESIMH